MSVYEIQKKIKYKAINGAHCVSHLRNVCILQTWGSTHSVGSWRGGPAAHSDEMVLMCVPPNSYMG